LLHEVFLKGQRLGVTGAAQIANLADADLTH
jgi:hypothetical protein